jgi:enoyl-CoA hydratase/carnithine racemase
MGLITRAVSAGELDEVVRQTLAAIASKAPLAIKIGRYALAVAEDRGFEDALDYLCNKLGEVVETDDAKEGLMAFMQKRPPKWTGR